MACQCTCRKTFFYFIALSKQSMPLCLPPAGFAAVFLFGFIHFIFRRSFYNQVLHYVSTVNLLEPLAKTKNTMSSLNNGISLSYSRWEKGTCTAHSGWNLSQSPCRRSLPVCGAESGACLGLGEVGCQLCQLCQVLL